MKRTLWMMILSLGVFLHAAAQDRICTTDGTVIECRISDFERFDGSVSYFLPGTEGLRLVTADGIKYIEIGGTKLVRDLTGKFAAMNTKQAVDAPRIEHYFGATGGYLSKFWNAGVSYTWFYTPRSGIGTDLLYYGSNEMGGSKGVQFLPRHESRIYIQRMGSFFVLQPGIGLGYYRTTGLLAGKPLTVGTLGLILNLNLGLDIKLSRGLYLNICGRVHWEPWATDVSGAPYGLSYHPHHSFGFMAGLRFGRER